MLSCSLALTPFENPRCTKEGHIFDLVNILPWLKKHGTNPVTGEKLASKDLITLHFQKNNEGDYHDPVTFKVFTENTRIVAISTSGNVYAAETVEELNFKTKNWRDLMTDETFTRKDVITIQDPHNLGAKDINQFFFKKNEIEPEKLPDTEDSRRKHAANNINAKGATARILSELEPKTTAKPEVPKESAPTPSFVAKKTKSYNEAHFSYNDAAAAFTSMGATVVTENARARFTDEAFLIMNVKGKGYARIKTNFGDLNVELYCGDAPKTCFNFIKLAKSGYYKGVTFHRLIRNFMLQGGDPTGTGRGGKSHFGEPFEDEIKPNLSHKERGILSMANRGLDLLGTLEKIPTDDDDKPKTKILMDDIEVLVDPYEELLSAVGPKKEKAKKAEPIPAPAPTKPGDSIGRYLETSVISGVKRQSDTSDISASERSEAKKKGKTGFGDFSSW
ncbi:RING-type E3 ubiquitin-protein ligase ppil2 [Dinochytrium kinnereticum]|nr:RING-type E3 ubiquitin-protein ligase ppil2 [Dinochytrium kinnereticum]